MKAKTIKAVCRKKVDEWLETIDDEKVRNVAAANTIITGGAIASMLLAEEVNDFDVYFRTREAALTLAEYYIERFKKECILPKFGDGSTTDIPIYIDKECEEDRIKIVVKSAGLAGEGGDKSSYRYFELDPTSSAESAGAYVDNVLDGVTDAEDETKPKYRPVFITSNAITLSNKIQLVIRFFGEPDEIHKNYDFVHCTCYWCSWNGVLELRKEALESLLARELRYVGSKYPLCSIIRTRKFIKRDWCINAGQYLKMAMQLNALDLNDVAVLEEQLVGVDFAYFQEIIDCLKAKNKKEVDSTYLMEIIDRVF